MDGHNVADFVDPDIEARLAELEAEEEAAAAAAEAAGAMAGDDEMDARLDEEEAALLAAIRARKAGLVQGHRRAKAAADNAPAMPRQQAARAGRVTGADMEASLGPMGYDTSRARARAAREGRPRGRSLSRGAAAAGGDGGGDGEAGGGSGGKRARSAAGSEGGDAAEEAEMAEAPPLKKRLHSNRSRSLSRGPAAAAQLTSGASPGSGGLKDGPQRAKALRLADRAQRRRNRMAKAGEGDRVILTKMPKHLFSGKRGNGKTDRR